MTQQAVDFEQRYRELCDFVSIVAHDLRTPLTSIRGYAQLLQRQARGDAQEPLRAGLGMIVHQADRLADQTEWLLEVARIETGRVALVRTRVDLAQVAHEAALALDPPITFSPRGDGTLALVDADVKRLRKVVHSILEFAAGRAALSPDSAAPAAHVEVDDVFVRLTVADQGEPLADQERARIFERLVLTSQDGRHRSLAHVGLVIAAGIAAAHGGRLEVESPVPGSDRGARLSLFLPQAR